MNVRVITIVLNSVMVELHRREPESRHELICLGLGDWWQRRIDLDMRLGHYGCELFVFCIDGESFKPIGSFGKDRFMLAKSNGFNVHYPLSSKVEAPMKSFEPAALLLVMVHMMLGSTSLLLGLPGLDEDGFLIDWAVDINPMAQVGTGGAIY